MDDAWHHVEQLQDRVLNHADKLQERCHHTKGDGPFSQLQATPDESQQIAQSEGAAEQQSDAYGELGALQHVSAQLLLHGVEPVGDPLLAA